MDWINLTVEIRGREIDLVVYSFMEKGGSNSYGSDEPAWFSLEVTDIRGLNKNKPVSRRLYDEIMKLYEDNINDKFFYDY